MRSKSLKNMVGMARFELATTCPPARTCANHSILNRKENTNFPKAEKTPISQPEINGLQNASGKSVRTVSDSSSSLITPHVAAGEHPSIVDPSAHEVGRRAAVDGALPNTLGARCWPASSAAYPARVGGRGDAPRSAEHDCSETTEKTEEKEGAKRPKRGEAPGLVYTLTSDKEIEIDCKKSRLKAMRRNVITSARLHQESLCQSNTRFKAAMLTLTYRDAVEWRPGQISSLLKSIREYLRARGHAFRFVWVMELTKRGIPHYHLIMWLPKGLTLPKPDKRGWWPHGFTRIEFARRAVGYIAKYASKGTDHEFPRGARIHGSGGHDPIQKMERRWWMSPAYVRGWWPQINDDVRRAVGGGWVSRITGEWRASAYRILGFCNGRVRIKRVVPLETLKG